MTESQTNPTNPFGSAGRAAAQQAWARSRTGVQARYQGATLGQRLGLWLMVALGIGIGILLIVPAVIIGLFVLIVAWVYLSLRRLFGGGRRTPKDDGMRQNVRVIRR